MPFRVGSVLPLAVALLLSTGSLRAQTDDQVVGDKPIQPGSLESLPEDVQSLLRLTNQDRAAAGLAPVHWDPALAAAAAQHVAEMADSGELEHQFRGEPDLQTRAARAGAHFSAIAENIAYAGDALAIERQWMNSPGHRSNILDLRMNAVGIATELRHGTLYAVTDFAATVDSLGPEQIEARVAQEVAEIDRHGAPPLTVRTDPTEARAVCSGATPSGLPRSPFTAVWQGAELALPAAATQAAASPEYREVAIGACPARQATSNGFSGYRVAILLR